MMEASVRARLAILASLVVSAAGVTTCVSPAPPAQPASPTPLPVCLDTHEPDDTVEQARTHFMHSLTVEGYICHPGDVDIFVTPATYGGYLLDFTVELYDLPADYDLYVYYYSQEIARSTHRGLAPEDVYYFSGPRTGNSYELKVVGVDGAFDPKRPYRLRFTMNPGIPTPTGHE